MRSAVLIVALLRGAARADDLPDLHDEASWKAMQARELAQHGRCNEALQLQIVIERLDAETARHAFTDDPYLARCVAGRAPGPVPPHPVRVAVPLPAACDNGGYFEPSLLWTYDRSGSGIFDHLATGVQLRSCERPMQVRFGASLGLGHVGQSRWLVGIGGETELSWTVNDLFRVGGHLDVEHVRHGYLVSADLRLHVDDVFWVQLGMYRNPGIDTAATGIALGAGFEGPTGILLGAVNITIGLVLMAVAAQSLTNTH